MSKNAYIWIGIAVLVILGGWYFMQSQTTQAPASTPQPQVSTEAEDEATDEASMEEDDEAMEETKVTISASGFNPKDITIKVGESVTWMNEDSVDHTVNSVPHPTHTTYKPLNSVGVLKSGEKKSLEFPEAGIYKYHDHLNPSLIGSVTVE